MPKSVLSWTQTDVADQFAAGHCAMAPNGPWGIAGLTDAKFDWDVTGWPKDVEQVAPLGGEIAVAGNGDNVDAAWDVIQWIADPKNVTDEMIKSLDLLPNRKDTQEDPRWAPVPQIATFVAQLEVAHPRSVYGPKYAEISPQIWEMEQRVLTGQTEAEAAAQAGRRGDQAPVARGVVAKTADGRPRLARPPSSPNLVKGPCP